MGPYLAQMRTQLWHQIQDGHHPNKDMTPVTSLTRMTL